MATHQVKKDGMHQLTGILIDVDPAGLMFTNPVPVRNESLHQKIGVAFLKSTKAGLIARINLNKGAYNPALTPVISIEHTEKTYDLKGAVTSRKGTITDVILSKSPSGDARIRPIDEQLKTE